VAGGGLALNRRVVRYRHCEGTAQGCKCAGAGNDGGVDAVMKARLFIGADVMKYILVLIAAAIISSGTATAQAFTKDNNYISAGYGFGTFAHAIIHSFTDKIGFDYSTTGPLYFKYERGLSNTVGLGLNLAYAQYSISYQDNTDNSTALYKFSLVHSSFSALLRLNLHIGNGEKFDPYWGIAAGYRSGSWKVTSTATDYESPSVPDLIPFGFETTFGFRYLFTENIGAYAEAGLAKSFFQVGLTAKF
jgi:hypothetical protein